jgi:hypothetical protein
MCLNSGGSVNQNGRRDHAPDSTYSHSVVDDVIGEELALIRI